MTKYDWTAMYVMHNALRRELEHLAKAATCEDAEARRISQARPAGTCSRRPCTSTMPPRTRPCGPRCATPWPAVPTAWPYPGCSYFVCCA